MTASLIARCAFPFLPESVVNSYNGVRSGVLESHMHICFGPYKRLRAAPRLQCGIQRMRTTLMADAHVHLAAQIALPQQFIDQLQPKKLLLELKNSQAASENGTGLKKESIEESAEGKQGIAN